MRRNHRGGIRGGQTWQNNSARASGPLMTDHLDLQDIDKELELLQRKREIIEQQQQILSNEFRRNDYQEPYRASHSQTSRYDDYTQSYNDTREYNSPSRKRPIQVWEDEIPNKRFSGPVKPKSRPFVRSSSNLSIPPLMRSGPTYRGGYQGSQPRQSIRPFSGPFKPKPKRDIIPPRKDANQPKNEPNAPKMTKSTAAPNKSYAHPVAERKVTEAANLTSETSQGDLNNMLCSDREPSKHVTGRLELALGSIIKEIKAADPSLVKSTAIIRDIKSSVRERIREVMMDRVVGPADTVVARYREVYDAQSDLEIVTNALESQSGEVTLLKIDDPEKYFKTNMHKIMHLKLKNLFNKVEDLALAEIEKPTESGDASEMKAEENAEKNETELLYLDEKMTSTPKFIALEKWMTSRMTVHMKKLVPFVMKLMNIDQKYTKLKNMITVETVKLLMQKDGVEVGEHSDEAVRCIAESLNSNRATMPRAPYKPLPYFAKLMGKPSLPKRNQMEKFFQEFNPKSIKKHRAVHNLLFVGFSDKESFDRILAADGTVIGRYTLSIRVSERSAIGEVVKPKQDPAPLDDKIIGSELDNQITDLLTCIRNSEENDESVDEATVKNEAGDDNTAVDANEGDKTTDANGDGEMKAENDASTDNAENGDTNNEDISAETENADANNGVVGLDAGDIPMAQKNDGIAEESTDTLQPLEAKPTGKSTPARVSARLAGTPGRIQTRRASRMTQNDA